MTYSLEFHPKALKEWQNLNHAIKLQLHKKLKERLENPKVPKDKLSGFENVYKIKLRNLGYRLAYEVKEKQIVVYVISIGKREKSEIYNSINDRLL